MFPLPYFTFPLKELWEGKTKKGKGFSEPMFPLTYDSSPGAGSGGWQWPGEAISQLGEAGGAAPQQGDTPLCEGNVAPVVTSHTQSGHNSIIRYFDL